MAGQEQVRPTRRGGDDDGPESDGGQVQARSENLDQDVDSILDEIDGVLESNAEEFVKSFVQKGGQ
ncbi:ubiquitin-like protein Pup [Nostocoides australiense]|uniref:Prokaryotic ubiquitin-like protein Pup n=1 Tax=Nostocoides australiense Ben110 TaxID=1193182 RepID=W6K135_9MICO|nr:ubiquitin-like protein Pup [Tetrasphaera australiensis]MCA0292131.1 ubiquitin-like protein Pup [Actinomycetota bacterium]MCB1301551.1 ubiquitin-like protein Pup [Tetrasphaera sp.]CCH75608.1 Prokaryotic ubiquitin-like protein Pup [Tetrasphaera australiensis Ben110]HPF80674.1 ubiquitin-like protein Pup [Tetrasphaera australiensis]HRW01615.1 ubiquitin-like protein Pup [Tetrasphaera sp.]